MTTLVLRRTTQALSRALCRLNSSAAAPLVTSTQVDRVTILTLNDPARLNALTFDMGAALQHAIDTIDYSKTNAVVVTGAGKAFSAGGDLAFLNRRAEDSGSSNAVVMRRFYQAYLRIRELPVPVLAAINGPAIGAGLCFALAADMRVAGKSAKLGVTFVGLGLHPGMGATHFLPRLVGAQIASRLILTGARISLHGRVFGATPLPACGWSCWHV